MGSLSGRFCCSRFRCRILLLVFDLCLLRSFLGLIITTRRRRIWICHFALNATDSRALDSFVFGWRFPHARPPALVVAVDQAVNEGQETVSVFARRHGADLVFVELTAAPDVFDFFDPVVRRQDIDDALDTTHQLAL